MRPSPAWTRGARLLLGLLGRAVDGALEVIELDALQMLDGLATLDAVTPQVRAEASEDLYAVAPATVSRLAAGGWAEHVPDADGRATLVPSARGRDLLAWLEQRHRSLVMPVVGGLDRPRQELVAAALGMFATAADHPTPVGGDNGGRGHDVHDRRRDAMGETQEDRDAVSAATEATLTASRALLGIVARSVASALELVSLPQFRILVVLSADGPLRVTTLAQRLGAVTSTFSRTLDRLAEGGWVVRTENPESRREVLVALTPQGRDLVDEVTQRRREEIRAVLDRLSTADRGAVEQALAAFSSAAGEPSTEDLLTLGL